MFKRSDHAALHVSDLEDSRKFYETHFGFNSYYDQVTPTGINIAYLKLRDTVLELVGRHEPPLKGFHWCIETTDFEKAYEYLTSSKIPIVQSPHPTDARISQEKGWRRAVFEGPDGEHIEIRG